MEIIATFVPPPGTDPRQEITQPPAGATMVELRADLLGLSDDLAALVAASPLPVLLTLRSAAEGGSGPDDPSQRRRFFDRAVTLPAVLVDLEVRRDSGLLETLVPRERAVLSLHCPAGVPPDLEEQVRGMLAAGSRLVKVVPTARSLGDMLAVLRLMAGLNHGAAAQRRGVVFAAGEAGLASRLLGPLMAAPVTFAAWQADRPAAAGQPTPGELLAMIGHLRGRPRAVFGVIGRGVSASLSPRMHNAAFHALGLPNLFLPLEVTEESELTALVAPAGRGELDELGLKVGGFAITMPWKEAVLPLCDVVAPRAQRAGAVNTVLPRMGKVLADCTDMDGITAGLLAAGVEVGGRRAVVLGSGGAARAAAVALDLAGAQVFLVGRDRSRTAAAARRTGVTTGGTDHASQCQVLVNATPAGRDGDIPPLLESLPLPAGATVVDLPYGPAATGLEKLAGQRGWRYVSGRQVLLFQGLAQFAAMHGMAPPVRAMAAALGLDEVQG